MGSEFSREDFLRNLQRDVMMLGGVGDFRGGGIRRQMSSGSSDKVHPQACVVHDTPSEIKRAGKSLRRRGRCNNISPELQQTIQLDAGWLDTITKTVSDAGSNIPAIYQPATIYKVPDDIRSGFESFNNDEYTPAVIAIGPYHCDGKFWGKFWGHPIPSNATPFFQKKKEAMQDHKWRCVNKLIARHHNSDASNHARTLLERCLVDMKTLERKVRNFYSEEIQIDSDQLALMMMLDGCFILSLLLNQDDSITDFKELEDIQTHGNLWIWQKVKYDLLLVENQIPLFIIEKLFDLLRTPDDANVNLVRQALKLFSNLNLHRTDAPNSIPTHQVHHLLHLFYLSIVPCELPIEQPTPSSLTPNWIPCAAELQNAGVKFKIKKNAPSFLDIKFSDGIMEIPAFEIHDYSIKLFRNLVAFEQCYPDTECHITFYAAFMDCVINSPNDVRLLHLNGILRDRTGIDNCAVSFFRKLCKEIHCASDKNYLSSVFIDVTKYQESRWHKWRAGLARDYFTNPWTAISVVAAALLLGLTLAQTFFTVYPYYNPRNK